MTGISVSTPRTSVSEEKENFSIRESEDFARNRETRETFGEA